MSSFLSSLCLRWVSLLVLSGLLLGACAEKSEVPSDAPETETVVVAPAAEPTEPTVDPTAATPTETAPAPPLVEEKSDEKPAETVSSPEKTPMKKGKIAAEGFEVATLGGGCFWCTEAVMERLEGVQEVVSGYMGGHVENPTYEQITSKTTGHAEVIQITYDPTKITFEELLDVFWQAHDPTTLNRQGADVGPQYRSVVFYHSPEQKNLAIQSKAKLDESKVYEYPAVTEISEASTFWEAEEEHQNYYELNKDSNPYCRVVISPKLKKLGLE